MRQAIASMAMLLSVLVACTRRDTVLQREEGTSARPVSAVSTATAGPAVPVATAPSSGPATTAPEHDASPSAPSSSAPKVAAWTDPEVVAHLVDRCGWEPENKSIYDGDPLACEANSFDQSCVYDPCFEPKTKCSERCIVGCNGCGGACAKKCEACKSGCTDDACRADCAKRCGACRQDCLTTKDRCASGACVDAYRACGEKVEREFAKSGCKKVCAKYSPCLQRCYEQTDFASCAKRCKAVAGGACSDDLLRLCDEVTPDSP
jgi:hypothetical protein